MLNEKGVFAFLGLVALFAVLHLSFPPEHRAPVPRGRQCSVASHSFS